ncbi:MAG: hypothetical protein AAGB12_11340 [Pseudomonadota bacterium]
MMLKVNKKNRYAKITQYLICSLLMSNTLVVTATDVNKIQLIPGETCPSEHAPITYAQFWQAPKALCEQLKSGEVEVANLAGGAFVKVEETGCSVTQNDNVSMPSVSHSLCENIGVSNSWQAIYRKSSRIWNATADVSAELNDLKLLDEQLATLKGATADLANGTAHAVAFYMSVPAVMAYPSNASWDYIQFDNGMGDNIQKAKNLLNLQEVTGNNGKVLKFKNVSQAIFSRITMSDCHGCKERLTVWYPVVP